MRPAKQTPVLLLLVSTALPTLGRPQTLAALGGPQTPAAAVFASSGPGFKACTERSRMGAANVTYETRLQPPGKVARPESSPSAPTQPHSLKLLLLDAKAGKPIPNQHVLLFYGDSLDALQEERRLTDLKTDANGLAPLPAVIEQAPFVQVWIDLHRTCVTNPNKNAIDLRTLSIKGLTVNHCSNHAFPTTPGVLTIAAREETFFERMSH